MDIVMVSYAGGDPTLKANRLFVFDSQAFRSLDELKKRLVGFAGHPQVHIVFNGADYGPRISQDEIDDLVSTCKKAGVWFTLSEGG